MGNEKVTFRDYSLLGVESKLAVEEGLADAEWYRSPVSRVDMRKILVRKDGPALRDTLIWFALLIGSGYLVFLLWGTWFAIFPYLVYSVLYASTSDSRWHETSHGTAFKTDWMNNALYEIASFMVLRQSTVWRWSHARHHSDTIIRGRDPEIAVPRPPDLKKIAMSFFGLSAAIPELRRIMLHARGRIDPSVSTYLPEHEYAKVFFKARIYILIYLFVLALSVYFRSLLPLMYIGLPTILGGWLMPVYGLTQHAGLKENVLDHRLNCRTVYMNRIHRFLYWNMNYHIEHHMFPLVPYHALPELHELVKEDYPVPYKGIIDAWKEIIPALSRQLKDPSYYVQRKVPEGKGNTNAGVLRREAPDADSLANGKIAVCSTDDLPEGEVMRFDFRQKTYAVYRTIANEYFATEGFCTHGNVHLAEGVLIGDTIECHKHNGRFNLRDGSPARIPVIAGIKTHRVEISSGKIILELEGSAGETSGSEDTDRIFRVISNRNITTFIKELVLSPLDGQKFSYRPGQYVKIIIPPFKAEFRDFNIDEPFGSLWKERGFLDFSSENTIYTKRNYSLVTNPLKDQYLKFCVRISLPPQGSMIAPGAGSSYIFNLKPDDVVTLTGPFGDFLIRDTSREMVYLGGGAGMAPLRSHLSYLFESEKTSGKVSFWYGARSSADLFYLDYFEKLQLDNSNFSFHVALSEQTQDDKLNFGTGYIHEYLRDNYLSSHAHPAENEYYLCGPPPMIEAALKMLKSFGISDDMISFDEF